jgi:hypothetical protein
MRSSLSALPCISVGTLVALSFVAGCGGHKRHDRVNEPVAVVGAAQPDANLDAIADGNAKGASVRRSGVPLNGQILHGETLRPGGTQDFRVQLDADHCYWFGGATNEMGQTIALTVQDPKGAEVASEKGKSTDALLEYCPATDGVFKLQSKLGHHGQFSVAVYQGTRLSPAVTAVGDATPEALIAKEALAAAPGAKQVGTFYEGTADQTSWSTALTKGKCYWFIGAGTPGKTKKLWLYLWDPTNSRITENKGESNVVTTGHCAKQTGMFKFQAKVYSGSGPYKVAVFEKE